MKKNFWRFIFHPEIIFSVIAIFIGIVVTVLGLIPNVNPQIVLTTILFVLSSIIPLLLANYKKIMEIESKVLNQSNNSIILQTMKEWKVEFEILMKESKEIWHGSNQGNTFLFVLYDQNVV